MIRSLKIFVLFAFALPAAFAQQYDLTYRLAEGTTYKFKRIENTNGLAQTQKGLFAEINKTVETFLAFRVEKLAADQFVVVYHQDTAFVSDRSTDDSETTIDFDNVLSKKPVRLTLTRRGEFRNAEPLEKLEPKGALVPVHPNMLARKALILPILPSKPLSIGQTWTDVVDDTSRPRYNDPRLGEGSGLRLTRVRTTYNVDSMVTLQGLSCLKIVWTGTVSVEGKIIFASSERFTEEESHVTGTLYVSVKDGLPIRFSIRNQKESTMAVFETDSEVVPTFSTTETTLLFLPS